MSREMAMMVVRGSQAAPGASLLDRVDFLRLDASRRQTERRKSELGQFLTAASVGRLMASMTECRRPHVRILDPGAGVGSLFAALVDELCQREERPNRISVTAYELDERLGDYLADTAELCRAECVRVGIQFECDLRMEDFVKHAAGDLCPDLFVSVVPGRARPDGYDCAILNPPYRKIHSASDERAYFRRLGIETSNLYAGFVTATIKLLDPGGELVAITPRSFCNGPYFRPFRELFLRELSLRRVHVFESRGHAFRDEQVLQENIIVHGVKAAPPAAQVVITSSTGPDDDLFTIRHARFDEVVKPSDRERFIHIVPDSAGGHIAGRMERFSCSLHDLGVVVSTGRVVEFRAWDFLQRQPEEDAAPLIYPAHFDRGYVAWPKAVTNKHNAIRAADGSAHLLIPNDTYVLVKRFSAKEERKRIVAAVHDPARIPGAVVGFENHLNYFHGHGRGLEPAFARGLAAFLNSTPIDEYFRQFNGHTQVNATDLRNLRYPSKEKLIALGTRVMGDRFPEQAELDDLVQEELGMSAPLDTDAEHAKMRIAEARSVLRDLGLPRGQQNDRSALTILALLDLMPDAPWSAASDPLRGITQMMDFMARHYGKVYAPNSRETVRRQTVHQLRDAGIALVNPDKPDRPVNSGQTVYQIERSALELLRRFGSASWDANLEGYLASIETLIRRYAQAREMTRIPVQVAPDTTITLSPGGQNVLVRLIIDDFASRFVPGGKLLYVGDTDEKFAYLDSDGLETLGIRLDEHGKMPDVVIHHTEKNWLILVEAVTSHGPVNPKRRGDLRQIFRGSTALLVFVTAFLSRKAMTSFLNDISWETDVWIAESPAHLIHFNGERFLGPY